MQLNNVVMTMMFGMLFMVTVVFIISILAIRQLSNDLLKKDHLLTEDTKRYTLIKTN